jgi:hypothetical protein
VPRGGSRERRDRPPGKLAFVDLEECCCMALPWLAIIAKSVPWVELARRAPDILAKSKELLEESRRQKALDAPQRQPTLDELRRRIAALEQRDAEHARLLEAMGEQLQGLTEGVRVLTARIKVLGWVAAILAVGLVATTIALRTAS